MSSYGILAVDLGILAVVAISGVLAFSRGFARELIALLALAAASAATYFLFPVVLPFAERMIGSDEIAAGATIVAVFVAVLILALVAAQPVAARVGDGGAGSVDRWLGLVFGIARGAMIVVVGYILFAVVVPVPEQPAWLREARLIPFVHEAADWLLSFVPAELQDEIAVSTRSGPAAGSVPAL